MLALSRLYCWSKQVRVGRLSSIARGFDILGSEVVGETDQQRTAIQALGDHSFLINNVLVKQSVLVFPNSFLAWSAKSMADLTVENLEVFTLLYPTVEILFVGCGEKMTQRFPAEIQERFRKSGIVIEATDTKNAAATFNVLNAEGRNVAAALLTIKPPLVSVDDL
ncbi:hypothetical protein EON65_41750 [archaeon]|nr:MAG: hypothetical protein EON65_41750 [archaeon]